MLFDHIDDSDGDGMPDCNDACDNDPYKTQPGKFGCGVPEDGCGGNKGRYTVTAVRDNLNNEDMNIMAAGLEKLGFRFHI